MGKNAAFAFDISDGMSFKRQVKKVIKKSYSRIAINRTAEIMIFSENEHYGLSDVGLSITNGIYSGTQAYHIIELSFGD